MSTSNVFYIASESESARIEFMESWLNTTGCVYSRIDGVETKDFPQAPCYEREKRLSRFGFDMTDSEVGCFFSSPKKLGAYR